MTCWLTDTRGEFQKSLLGFFYLHYVNSMFNGFSFTRVFRVSFPPRGDRLSIPGAVATLIQDSGRLISMGRQISTVHPDHHREVLDPMDHPRG